MKAISPKPLLFSVTRASLVSYLKVDEHTQADYNIRFLEKLEAD